MINSNAAQPTENLICSYREYLKLLAPGVLVFSLCVLVFATFVRANNLSADELPLMRGVFQLLGLLVLILAVYLLIQRRNESISVLNGVITWTDWTGKVKVRCHSDDVVKGSLVKWWSGSGSGGGLIAYSVDTSQGLIRWHQYISDIDDLLAVFSQLTDQPEGARWGKPPSRRR